MPTILTRLGIDQMRFIVRLKGINTNSLKYQNSGDVAIYKAAREHVYSCTQDWLPGAKHWETKWAMTKSVYPLGEGSALSVGFGYSSKTERHFITTQFNPSKLTYHAAIELLAAFQCMYEWGYDDFFTGAVCQYVEVPLDVVGASMSDYLFFDTRLRSCNAGYEEDGTLYLGSRTSSRYVTIYDKAKEVADKGGPVSAGQWLRIESKLKPDVPATQLCDLPNPFATLRVLDRKKLAAIEDISPVRLFRDRVSDGLQPQAAYSAASDRKALLAGLQLATADWFDPDSVWKLFPAAAHRVTPEGVHTCAQLPYSPPPEWPPIKQPLAASPAVAGCAASKTYTTAAGAHLSKAAALPSLTMAAP